VNIAKKMKRMTHGFSVSGASAENGDASQLRIWPNLTRQSNGRCGHMCSELSIDSIQLSIQFSVNILLQTQFRAYVREENMLNKLLHTLVSKCTLIASSCLAYLCLLEAIQLSNKAKSHDMALCATGVAAGIQMIPLLIV
jgi:hypothetical protein